MKVSDAINFCLQYHKINSRPNTIKNYEFLLGKFRDICCDRKLESIVTQEIISFLADLSEGRKQTKRSRYTTLSAFFNLIINAIFHEMRNPCLSPAAKNLFTKPKIYQWTIFDKDAIDEAIFRTINVRNRIMLGAHGTGWNENQ